MRLMRREVSQSGISENANTYIMNAIKGLRACSKIVLTWLTLSMTAWVLTGLFQAWPHYLVSGWKGACSVYTVSDALCGLVLSLPLYMMTLLARPYYRRALRSTITFWCFIVAELLMAVLLALGMEWVELTFQWRTLVSLEVVTNKLIYCLITAILILLISLQRAQSAFLSNLRHKERLELNLFKHQLDPHFLFNSLSFVQGLIDEEPDTAKRSLHDLTLAYRYLLSHSIGERVYIAEAIRFVHIYTSFLTMRFPGHFDFRIDTKLEDSLDFITPFALQILIENAVKHNKHSVKVPLGIVLKRDYNWLVVTNTRNPLQNTTDSYGVGLRSLIRRYEIAYARRPEVRVTPEYYEVKIPIIKNENINS